MPKARSQSALLESKKNLREALIDRRSRLNKMLQLKAGRAVTKKLFETNEVGEALEIALYWSFRGEIPTQACFQKLRRDKNVYFPRVNTQSERLEFARVDRQQQLRQGAWGLLEPDIFLEPAPLKKLQVIVVPGVAFDIAGHRIGWGKGYYDRLLKGFKGIKIGLAYDFQVLENIPSGRFDVAMDLVVTESRVIECRKN